VNIRILPDKIMGVETPIPAVMIIAAARKGAPRWINYGSL